jgi:hypothetical protein
MPADTTQARVDTFNSEITPTNKGEGKTLKNESLIAERFTHIDFTTVSKIRTFKLNPNQCSRYRLSIRNDAAARFSVLINAKDIVMLPSNTTLPGKLQKGKTQLYELPITERTRIKVVLRMCQNGQMRVGMSQDKSAMASNKFQQEFQTNGLQSHYANTFEVHPGIVYLFLKSLSTNVEYTIEVYIMDTGDDGSIIVAHLPNRRIAHRYVGMVDM